MAWGADDHGGNVSKYPTYRESDPLFDRFIRHECASGLIDAKFLSEC